MEQKITTMKNAYKLQAEHKAPKKKKNFYKEGDRVLIKDSKTYGVVKALDIQPQANIYKATVEVEQADGEKLVKVFDLWEIKQIRSEKSETKSTKKALTETRKRDRLCFAKVRPDAIIPSKRREDAGYDFCANFAENELHLPKGKVTAVPTGIASAMSPKYYLNLKHERGSTGKHGMAVLSGVVDSGYRDEIFIAIAPTHKDIIISKIHPFETKNGKLVPDVRADSIVYPYSMAIAQGTLDIVPDVEVVELSLEELQAIKSERGTGKYGSSGK